MTAPTLALLGGPHDGSVRPYVGPVAPDGYARPTLRRDAAGNAVSGRWEARWVQPVSRAARKPYCVCEAAGCPGRVVR